MIQLRLLIADVLLRLKHVSFLIAIPLRVVRQQGTCYKLKLHAAIIRLMPSHRCLTSSNSGMPVTTTACCRITTPGLEIPWRSAFTHDKRYILG